MKIFISAKLIKPDFYPVINLLIRIKTITRLFYTINPFFAIILRFNLIIIFLIRYFNIRNLPILNLNNYKLRVNILFIIRLDIFPTIAPYTINSSKCTKLKLILYV